MKTKHFDNSKTHLLEYVVYKNTNITVFLKTYVDYNLIFYMHHLGVFFRLYLYGIIFIKMNKLYFEKQIIANLYDNLNNGDTFYLNMITRKDFDSLWYRNFITDLLGRKSFYKIERLNMIFKVNRYNRYNRYKSGESK